MAYHATSIVADDITETSSVSELNSSLLDRENSPTNASTQPAIGPRKRTRTSLDTWSHARDPRANEPIRGPSRNRIFYCKHCATYKTESLTSARHHLKGQHGRLIEATVSTNKRQRTERIDDIFAKARTQQQTQRELKEEEILLKTINEEAFLEALTQLIARRDLSYSCVEWPELQALLITINPMVEKFLVKARGDVPKLIEKSYIKHREILTQKLQNSLSKIHFTIDVWQSPNRKEFLAICVHFVDGDDKQLKKALVALPQLFGGHGSEQQLPHIRKVLEDFNIVDKIGYFVGDNHGSNDKLLRLLSRVLRDEFSMEYHSIHHRIRCQGHIVNLAVQAFLFAKDKEAIDEAIVQVKASEEEVEPADQIAKRLKNAKASGWRQLGALGKIHNIATTIRSSELMYQEFHELAGKALHVDNETRWNSWALMLEIAIEKQQAVDEFVKRHWNILKDDFITPEDWQFLKETTLFLKPFHRVTLATQHDQSTLDQTLVTMDVLVRHFEKAKNKYQNQPHLLACIITGWYAFDKYYAMTDQSHAYAAALLLHPSRRKRYINQNWKPAWRKNAVEAVKKLWESQYRDLNIATVSSPKEEVTEEPDEFDLLLRDLNVTQRSTKDDFQRFIDDEPHEILGTALAWWTNEAQRHAYPRLSQMAIDILSVPAMSAEAERVFSGARRTISWSRARLSGENISRGECLKHWLKSFITSGPPLIILREAPDLIKDNDGEKISQNLL